MIVVKLPDSGCFSYPCALCLGLVRNREPCYDAPL